MREALRNCAEAITAAILMSTGTNISSVIITLVNVLFKRDNFKRPGNQQV